MRVLRFHARYARTGGEDRSVRSEVDLLRREGVEVIPFLRSNGDLIRSGAVRTLDALRRTAYDRKLFETVRQVCQEHRPDVAHADNLWFSLSPSVHAACHAEGVPTVQSLRNYRLLCVNANLVRGGKPCEACLTRGPWIGVVHRCYHASAFLSALAARVILRNRRRGTWDRDVDLFIAPSAFTRAKFIQAGMAPGRIVVKPNFLEDPGPAGRPGTGGVFVGRLSREKGAATLLEAWKAVRHVPLSIVGDGPDRRRLEDTCRREGLESVRFTGWLSPRDCLREISSAAFLVFPSECYETFGRSMVEAYARGRPVIASRLGAAAEIVEEGTTGLLFEAGDPEDLAKKAAWMATHAVRCREMGRNARERYERLYTPERNVRMLIKLYERATDVFGRKPAAMMDGVR